MLAVNSVKKKKKTKTNRIDDHHRFSSISPGTRNMDRISYLPQSILHDILSRLPDEDATRTSVLSKAWYDAWSTLPFLVFDESRCGIPEISDDVSDEVHWLLGKFEFIGMVTATLLRFACNRLAIRKFKLLIKTWTPPDMLSRLDNWMKLACESGVEELQLDNGFDVLRENVNPRPSFTFKGFAPLPLCVLQAKSLIKLSLSWDFSIDEAFLNHPIKFSALQELSLSQVYVGDGKVIENVISSCPLIEAIELTRCSGLKSVSIRGLPKLKRVFIVGIEEVDIDAPSLEDLLYDVLCFKADIPCKINVDKCTNLQELCLIGVSSIVITDQWFIELFQKFPLLEKLVLERFYMPDTINISSIQLKILNLCYCYDTEEIWIDAPNLYNCTYHGDGSILPSISILSSSSQMVFDVNFFVDPRLDLEILRGFLEEIKPKHFPVSLFVGFCDNSTVDFDLSVFEDYVMAPPSIEHLSLNAFTDTEEWCLLLVTGILWSCRPSFISFNLNANKTLVKIFCEKLIDRKEDAHCCSSDEIKCWWHFLKDVKVSSSFRKHNVADDIKSLLEAFPTLSSEEEDEISRFEEEAELNLSVSDYAVLRNIHTLLNFSISVGQNC
ncbi:hypothetical protein RIF29_28463 [Crotalaria pallida]|uniref:F-box domain-containing protein n=1 Tax=Crotalaria pallida TaxID=3830 RepID=A0AAN9EF29_CROPI